LSIGKEQGEQKIPEFLRTQKGVKESRIRRRIIRLPDMKKKLTNLKPGSQTEEGGA